MNQNVLSLLFGGVLYALPTKAQNYVPNPDFEAHGDCSEEADWEMLFDWGVPLGCSAAGYLNSCTPPPLDIYQGVPTNFHGFEFAHSGEGHILQQTFSYTNPNPKSYVTSTFSANLPPGEHCVRFWMSWGDSAKCRSKTFHALLTFSLPEVLLDQDSTWAADAQLTFNTAAVDGNGWYLMLGTFTSTEPLRRLTLGNFLKGAALLADTIRISTSNTMPTGANYYIDDVYVGPCDVAVPEMRHWAALELFPNPATDVIRVSVGDAQVDYLEVLNVIGAVVLRQRAGSSPTALDVSGLTPGPYMVRAFVEGRPVTTRSFVRIAE